MKKILLIICLFPILVFSQKSYKIPADSTILNNIGSGKNELVIRNATSNITGGVLTNLGNGVTAFVLGGGSARVVDTIYKNNTKDSIVFTISGIRYAVKDSSGGGVTQQALNDSIARLDSTIKNNSAIFPNGVKIIEDTTYTLSSADAGYYLVATNANTHFIMPDTCPFSVGDVIGLYGDLDATTFDLSSSVTDIELFTGQSSENGEIVILQCVDVGAGAEMLPLTAIKNDNGVLKTLNKYLYDNQGGGDFIPISGTVSGSPVTGDIEFSSGALLKHINENEDAYNTINIASAGIGLTYAEDATTSTQLSILNDYVGVSAQNNEGFRGLTGALDYSTLIGSLDYPQKIYVDQRISDTATQIRSEIPDVSNFATKTNLADTSALLRSLIPTTATFTISKNSAKDSIVTVFNGTRSAVKDSIANLTNYVTNTTLTDSLAEKTNKLISFNAYTTSDTLRLTDADKVIEMNVGTANDLVIPTNTAYAFPVGTQIVLIQIGAGQTTLVPAGGVTVRSSSSKLKLTGQYSGATLIKKNTNEWYLFGDITN